MKILHGRAAHGRAGGIEHALFDLSREEGAAGHAPSLALALGGGPPFPIPDQARARGLSVHPFEMQSVWSPGAYARWAGILLRVRPDLLHLHDPRSMLLAGTTAPLRRAPAVVTPYGWDPARDASRARWNRDFLARASAVVAGSRWEADALRAFLPPKARVEVIPPGVDVDRFRPDAAAGTLRADIRVPQGAPIVGYVARLNGDRQPGDFLRAAVRVQQRQPDAFFCAVGDGRLRAYLDAMEPARALGPAIRFSGFRDDMESVYPAMSVMVVTWSPRYVPRGMLEAMASGVPVVAPRTPVLEDVVEDGVNGVLVREGNFQLMATRAAELLADPARASALGAAARERVAGAFTAREAARRTLDLYAALA